MKKKIKNTKTDDTSMARVLYQRLGKDWYAFAEVDGDCFMSKVSASVAEFGAQDESQQSDEEVSHTKKRKAA